jgi:hypothetical protein
MVVSEGRPYKRLRTMMSMDTILDKEILPCFTTVVPANQLISNYFIGTNPPTGSGGRKRTLASRTLIGPS